MISLTVNGQVTQSADTQSVRDLVASLGLCQKPVAVEINQELIPRDQHAQILLQDGDVVEIVTLVGGG